MRGEMNVGNLFAEFLQKQSTEHSGEWGRGVRDFAVYLMQFSESDDTLPCPVCNNLMHVTLKGEIITHGSPRCEGSGAKVRKIRS
jgi:hypothetical protein